MVHRRTAAPKHKNHAQDCRTLIDRDQRPAILPWLSSSGWRPSLSLSRALARCVQRPDCCWALCFDVSEPTQSWHSDHALSHDERFGSHCRHPETSCKNARNLARVYFNKSSTTNVVLLEQRLVARLVRLAEIVEQRAAGLHELQQAPARMVVLDVALEMFGQVANAFRQDRNLNLRRTRVAGLGGTCLDDFRFAFGGNRHRQTLS